MTTPLYDAFSADYDRFVDWDTRLAGELPLIEAQLAAVRAKRVLDVACGTGQHAIALAQRGYEVVGTDASAGMVGRARENARAEGLDLAFLQAAFGEVAAAVEGTFDAVLCLGSSLPHVLTAEALAETVRDWTAVLRVGGLLFVQNRNFDGVLRERNRWMPPKSYRDQEGEWLFLRFYDFEGDGSLTFHVVTLRRCEGQEWQQRDTATRLWPWRRDVLAGELGRAGYADIACWGDMRGSPYAGDSPNLVIAARKTNSL